MTTKLQKGIKQNKPFKSLGEETILNIMRTAEYLSTASAALFKSADLTGTQYNVLRILRGAGNEGLSCREIGERMVTKESDITRLLDRIENRSLISRERPANNRRTVIARISDEGLKILAGLDKPLEKLHHKLVGHLGENKLRSISRLMETIREKE